MIKFRRNCKRGERKSQGTKGAQKHAKSLACENFATKIAPLRNDASSTKSFHSPRLPFGKSRSRYKKGFPLPNHFAAQAPPPAKHSSSTRRPFRNPNPYFATTKRLRNPPRLHFATQTHSAKCPFGTRVPFRSPTLPFRSCEMACEVPHKNAPRLRNSPLPAK